MTAALPMRRIALAALMPALPILAALALSGCSSDKPPPACPPVGTPKPLDSVTQFVPGGGQDLTQVRFSGLVKRIDTTCDYDEKGVDVDLGIALVIERGPADRDRKAALQYFVAVEDGPGNITAKKIFDVEVPFEGASRRLAKLEEVSLRIPAPKEHGFKDTRVLVGFQLTPDQLAYNRKQKP